MNVKLALDTTTPQKLKFCCLVRIMLINILLLMFLTPVFSVGKCLILEHVLAPWLHISHKWKTKFYKNELNSKMLICKCCICKLRWRRIWYLGTILHIHSTWIHIQHIYSLVHQWLHCPLLDPGCFSVLYSYTQSVGLHGWKISPSLPSTSTGPIILHS
jgi:hypothetical protein